jgi:hypothetical protein
MKVRPDSGFQLLRCTGQERPAQSPGARRPVLSRVVAWMALTALLAPITARADNLEPQASAPTLQWAFETFGDAKHIVERQHQLTQSLRDTNARVWRWRVIDDQVMQAGIERGAQHAGLSFELAAPNGEPIHPAQLLRALDLKVSTAGSRAAEWRVRTGWGPESLDHSRESIAWWRDLHTSRWRLQAYPELLSTKWSLDYSRLRVLDGNRVLDYALRADPGWAAFANESWQLFAVLQHRVADMRSPFYWTPTSAEASGFCRDKYEWPRKGELLGGDQIARV